MSSDLQTCASTCMCSPQSEVAMQRQMLCSQEFKRKTGKDISGNPRAVRRCAHQLGSLRLL